ncbi:MAG: VCBS repeat-containing protein [Melioribacteraceae bacterium]|nr:VCBS repeat-containing protein [Melioribacteraceae bacterium]MCF8265354.1 VCBS repeat-containing protein [Melioribacteraceae bacterium]MCF8430496.1 VCBS repeat-containing protein [Melioribacteraceae bacterium]
MKHLKEGRIDLNFALRISLFFLLIYSSSLSQINTNGFIDLQEFSTLRPQSKILKLDFNNDGIFDILLYNEFAKGVSILKGVEEGFDSAINKFFFYPLTQIKKLHSDSSLGDFYIFISRSLRLAGLVTITPYGTLQLMTRKNLNSYPSKIEIVDLDNDGINEALVFGSNYEGITILSRNGFSLDVKKYVDTGIFPFVLNIDFDYDGLNDIVAYNLLKSEIDFFYNSNNGEIELERSIPLLDYPHHMITTDFNNDGFVDILYAHKLGITALHGDSVSSFSKSSSLLNYEGITNFVLEDLNYDLLKDISFLAGDGQYFAPLSEDLSPVAPIKMINDSSLTDLELMNGTGYRSLIIISQNRKLYELSKFNPDSEKSLKLPWSSSTYSIHDYNRDGMPDISFLNSNNNNFGILINSTKTPVMLYEHQDQTSYQYIIPQYVGGNEYLILAYNSGADDFELIRFNYSDGTFLSQNYYTEYPIVDIKLQDYFLDNQYVISSILAKEDSLFLQSYYLENGEMVSDQLNYISSDTSSVLLDVDISANVYVADVHSDSLNLSIYNFEIGFYSIDEINKELPKKVKGNLQRTSILEFKDGKSKYLWLEWKNLDLLYDIEKKRFLDLKKEKSISGFLFENIFKSDILKSFENLVVTYKKTKNEFEVFSYSKVNGYKSKTKFIVSDKIDNYFVARLFQNKLYLIYLDSQNKIVMKRIDD